MTNIRYGCDLVKKNATQKFSIMDQRINLGRHCKVFEDLAITFDWGILLTQGWATELHFAWSFQGYPTLPYLSRPNTPNTVFDYFPWPPTISPCNHATMQCLQYIAQVYFAPNIRQIVFKASLTLAWERKWVGIQRKIGGRCQLSSCHFPNSSTRCQIKINCEA